MAEGPKIAEELLLTMPSLIMEIYAVQEWINSRGAAFGVYPITLVESFELEKISQLSTPNQVLLVLKQKPASDLFTFKGELVLALDTIQDPGNLGTIIRIADWFGVRRIICSLSTTDQYNPKVIQSTMGSIGRVELIYTDLPGFITDTAVETYAAALAGSDFKATGKLKEGMIIIGNESKGIDPAILAMVRHKITIPRVGHAESLNAAVATGIILSHVVG